MNWINIKLNKIQIVKKRKINSLVNMLYNVIVKVVLTGNSLKISNKCNNLSFKFKKHVNKQDFKKLSLHKSVLW